MPNKNTTTTAAAATSTTEAAAAAANSNGHRHIDATAGTIGPSYSIGTWFGGVPIKMHFIYFFVLILSVFVRLPSITASTQNNGFILFVDAFQVKKQLTSKNQRYSAIEQDMFTVVDAGFQHRTVVAERKTGWMLSAKPADDDNDNSDGASDDANRKREIDQLQKELDAITAPPKTDDQTTAMFGSFDADRIDESKIPIPLFTAVIVLVLSLGVTFELYNIGLNGFPEAATTASGGM